MNFLGTLDSQPLELKVAGARALRLEPDTSPSSSPNFVGGYGGNVVSNGYHGAFIGGGGYHLFSNTVGNHYASVLGGFGNLASGYGSTAMGLATTASAFDSTAMGDTSTASGSYSTAIGFMTTASGDSSTAMGDTTIASGNDSTAAGQGTIASGDTSTAMGAITAASGNFSTALGHSANALNDNTFVWSEGTSFSSSSAGQFLVHAFGGVGIGTAQTPPNGLRVGSGGLAVTGASSPNYPGSAGVFIEKVAGYGGAVYAYDYNANAPLSLALNSPGGNVGIGTLTPQNTLDVNGTTRTHSIIITGGADLAEPFKIGAQRVQEGSVVVIDEAHPGQLKLSTSAYDTRVAGIVSGANGINPGIALHQEGGLEGGQNVALTGRVYVLADATNGAIKPGDLLTTSYTPGHAMRVTDHAQAQGAVLGKAMGGLQAGKGMVLTLVTLQ
jgi:hypothetical protein